MNEGYLEGDCEHEEYTLYDSTSPKEAYYSCDRCDLNAVAVPCGTDEWGHVEYELGEWNV